MKKLNFLFLMLAFVAATIPMSCTDNSAASINTSGLTIKGELAKSENLSFYFDKINFDNTNFMHPKVEIDGKGKFQMNFNEKLEPAIYRLRVGAKKTYIILDGTEKVVGIKGDLDGLPKFDYELTGAPASTGFLKSMKGYKNRSISKDDIAAYVKSETNSLAAAFVAMQVFGNDESKIGLLQTVQKQVETQHPGSKYASDFKAIVQGNVARIAARKATENIQVGKPAPEIKLSDPNGKEIALSDLKGKVVLLDFWASWCGPCRKANPHVVQTYKKYKNQGFTVYSVSLDGINPRLKNRYKTAEELDQQTEAARKRWVDAIAKDQLEWTYHVSDLQYWQSVAAKAYGVRSIPQTFLIDRDGKIAALNPRFNLEQELKKLL